jgi:hypothetical protein
LTERPVRPRLACLLTGVLVGCAAPAAADGAARAHWKPIRLAKEVVTANIKAAVPHFRVLVGGATCSGQATTAHCTVRASVSHDDVTGRISFTRHRDGTHLKYVDKLRITAVTGSGTSTRTYFGNVYM